MSRSGSALRIAVGGALAGAIGLVQGASGQDRGDPTGMRAVFDYSLGIDVNTNEDLRDPSPGTYSAIVNNFDFSLLSNTRVQSLALDFGTQLRIKNDPDDSEDGVVVDFEQPRFNLEYARESVGKRLGVSANFEQVDVDDIEPFFIDLDGDTIIDEAAFTDDDGTLTEAGGAISLETGRNSRVGTTYTFSYLSREYSDTSDPSLTDRTDYRFSTSTRLEFTDVTTGFVDLFYRNYEYSQGRDLTGEEASISLGVFHEFSEILTFDGSLGYSKSHEDETISGVQVIDITHGPNAFFELTRELPNGSVFGNYSRQLIDDTFRNSLTFGRSISLPNYDLVANVGLTNLDGGDPLPTFLILYTRPLPTGQFSAALRRTVTLNTDDEERTLSSASFGYSQEINDLSSFRLGFDYSLVGAYDDDTTDDDDTRATFSAAYVHALTRDWDMSVGYTARSRNSDNEEAYSNAVFMNVGRRFTLRP